MIYVPVDPTLVQQAEETEKYIIDKRSRIEGSADMSEQLRGLRGENHVLSHFGMPTRSYIDYGADIVLDGIVYDIKTQMLGDRYHPVWMMDNQAGFRLNIAGQQIKKWQERNNDLLDNGERLLFVIEGWDKYKKIPNGYSIVGWMNKYDMFCRLYDENDSKVFWREQKDIHKNGNVSRGCQVQIALTEVKPLELNIIL